MDNYEFEQAARIVARMLWTRAAYGGAEIVDGRERDGIFETDDVVHVLEVTTSRQKVKAATDCTKLADLIIKLRRRNDGRAHKGWFVTLDEPTADQRSTAKEIALKKGVHLTALGYDAFRTKLINAREYLDARRSYPFGSVRDPETGGVHDQTEYIKLGMYDVKKQSEASVDDLGQLCGADITEPQSPVRVVLMGDYGAGKSKTVQHLFNGIADAYRQGRSLRFPVLLNLYDHHGQYCPTEALHRHSKLIGFNAPDHLVRAWRAGLAILFLDGFDELATSGWSGQARRLSIHRQRAVKLVRTFVEETPSQCPIFIAGRLHFFDSTEELVRALGLGSNCRLFSLNEFTEDQVHSFLRARGWEHSIPDWMPTRPLLLGYLAARGFLNELTDFGGDVSAADGWDRLIDLICEREARIDPSMDGRLVRTLLERIATKARGQVNGLGPIMQIDMTDVFQEVCGYVPDENGVQLLQRLPGLGVARQTDEAREFIDADFADVLRSGDIVRFCSAPFMDAPHIQQGWNCGCGGLGLDVTARQTEALRLGSSEMSIAAETAVQKHSCPMVAAEIVGAMAKRGLEYNRKRLVIHNVLMPDLELDSTIGGLQNIEFADALFCRLCLDASVDRTHLPTFRDCYIELLETTLGIATSNDGPLLNCTIDSTVNSASTNDQVLGLAIPEGTKVLLTILRKLFLQSGSGRRENAFYRGLDQHAQLLVPDVLKLVNKHDIARPTKVGQCNVWLPNRPSTPRVRKILASPVGMSDKLVLESREIQ